MNNDLIAAVKNNDHASIKSILESNPEISKDLKVALASDQVSIKTRGIFLYYFAITNNKDDFVDLLKHKCDKLFNFYGQDVLKLVIRNNWIDLFDSVYEQEHEKNKPLEYAIKHGSLDFVKLLLSKGCKVDNNNIKNMIIPDSMKEFFLNYESKIPKQSDIGAVVGKEFGSGWCNGFVALFAHYYLNDSLSLYTEMLNLASKSSVYSKEYGNRYNKLFFEKFMKGTSSMDIFADNLESGLLDYFHQKSLEVLKGQILILQKGQILILQKPVEGLNSIYYQKQIFNNLSLLSDKVKKLKPQSYVSEFDESSMTSFLEYLQINLTTRRTAIQIYSYSHAMFLGFDASTKRFTFWDPNSEKYYVTNDLKQLSNLILSKTKDLSFIINSENAISLPYEKMKISKTSENIFCADADKEAFEYVLSNLNFDLSVENLSSVKNGNSVEVFEMFGWHVLCSAVDNNDIEKFESCINEFGCDFRDPFDGSTILMYLVQKKRLDLIEKYDFEGIKDFQDHNGQTALMYASKGSSSSKMREIISYLKGTMQVDQNKEDFNDRTADIHFKANAWENLSFFGSADRSDGPIEDKEERKPHP